MQQPDDAAVCSTITGTDNIHAVVCTAVHAEGHKEASSKSSVSRIHILEDDVHKAQDLGATEVTVWCWTLSPRKHQMEDSAL